MKTTGRKIISEIDFNNKQLESTPDWGGLANEFDIYHLNYSEDPRLKAYHLQVWYCTDSWVGTRAYFLDGEFVATSYQKGRKYDEEFEFVSIEVAEKVRDYLLSLLKGQTELNVSIMDDLDEEIEDTYKIEFNEQILHSHAFYKGEKVKILNKRGKNNEVEIEQSGVPKKVNCRELDFAFNKLD